MDDGHWIGPFSWPYPRLHGQPTRKIKAIVMDPSVDLITPDSNSVGTCPFHGSLLFGRRLNGRTNLRGREVDHPTGVVVPCKACPTEALRWVSGVMLDAYA